MSVAQRMIDHCHEITVTNLDALPKGTGAPFLLVVCTQYDQVYVAKRWMRKLPKSVAATERIIRF